MNNPSKIMSQKGFSLVEVMAGLLIGLVTTVVIYQVLAVSEGYKRTATGGSEATQSGGLSLYLLERDIRQAGAGLDKARFGDQINASDGARNFDFVLAPVRIVPGAGNAADSVTAIYANTTNNGDIKKVAAPGMGSASDPVAVSSSYGVQVNDLFIIAAPGLNGALGRVSGITGNSIEHQDAVAPGARYNADGFPVAYPQAASFMSLGSINATGMPGLNTYTVANNQLQMTQQLISGTPDVIADNIFTIKAQYGLDTNGDNVVDTFTLDPTTADGLPAGNSFAQVRAVRVAVLARIGYMEKQAVSPATIKLWADSTSVPTTTGPSISLTGIERNFRYRVFTTTVPLRNVIW